jgi:membrane carboxypeptidase/penicillin-binding protein PbpC
LIDPTLRREFQTLTLRVAADTTTTVHWSVNGTSLAERSSEAAASWPLRLGTHRISARDAQGHTSEITVVVR